MKYGFIFLLLLVQQTHAQFQQKVNYTIDVQLNDVQHSLDGTVKIEYINNSPDSLQFLYVHLWMNAFKSDRTAFSEQQLKNRNTQFYFSEPADRGYINQLNFKVNGLGAKMEDDETYIDFIKLVLPQPLPPGAIANLSTPFHVKLPKNWSRGGHINQTYCITQWFPKIAMYDAKGWHPMPYLDQGEYYDNFGKYDVRITVPENYVVAATGQLQNDSERQWLLQKANQPMQQKAKDKIARPAKTPSATNTKTLRYVQDNVHDFAWFADKNFLVRYDTLNLNNKKIDVWSFFVPSQAPVWKNSITYMKRTIVDYSSWLGDYGYDVVSAVATGKAPHNSAMEYPTIAQFDESNDEQSVDLIIAHELGHNWFQGMLANNERANPWLDEGLNTFYEFRYKEKYYGKTSPSQKEGIEKAPKDLGKFGLSYQYAEQKDQPIASHSADFTSMNYGLIAYLKTSQWMQLLQEKLGAELFEKSMQAYFKDFQYKHPTLEDFKKSIEQTSGQNLDAVFAQLTTKGALSNQPPVAKKQTKITGFFNFHETDKYNYISLAPAIGFNAYDGFMIGALAHNYQLPTNKWQFVLAPMLGTKSGALSGLGRLGYNWRPKKWFEKAELALSAASFSYNQGIDSLRQDLFAGFTKFVPEINLYFKNNDPHSTITKWINWKTFIITEKRFDYQTKVTNPDSGLNYVSKTLSETRYLNQLSFGIQNNRVLYPYDAVLQLQQAEQFLRIQFTGNYFLNYNQQGQGVQARFFAGKFFYLTTKNLLSQANLSRYHFGMSNSPSSGDDYTYSNPIVERRQNDNVWSRQIFVRDGGFKFRNDFFGGDGQGRSDDWLVAANFVADVPDKWNPLSVLPFKIPIKVFVDIGTQSGAWEKGTAQPRFLYDAGLQLQFLKVLKINYVLFNSAEFDYPSSLNGPEWWQRNLTFSIDLPLRQSGLLNAVQMFGGN
jgi:hypothetical protein